MSFGRRSVAGEWNNSRKKVFILAGYVTGTNELFKCPTYGKKDVDYFLSGLTLILIKAKLRVHSFGAILAILIPV